MTSLSKETQIPADLGKFRIWADRECCTWPADLQIKAYDVCLGRRTIEEFATEYAALSR